MRYRLLSTPMICAPGIVAWAMQGYAFKSDRTRLARLIADGWKVPLPAAHALLSGSVPYTVDSADTVEFSIPADRLTQSYVRARLAARNVTFRRTEFGEFRVNLKGESESTAAYESDLQMALDTGLAMADHRDSEWRPRGRHRIAALFSLDSYRGRLA